METKHQLSSELQHLIAEGTSQGIGAAIALWVRNEKLDVLPTDKSANPIDDFSILLTADYTKDKEGYPFEEQSIKAELDAIISEHLPAIEIIYLGDELPDVRKGNVKKLVRYLVCGQTLDFLKPKAKQVQELFDKIQTEGIS